MWVSGEKVEKTGWLLCTCDSSLQPHGKPSSQTEPCTPAHRLHASQKQHPGQATRWRAATRCKEETRFSPSIPCSVIATTKTISTHAVCPLTQPLPPLADSSAPAPHPDCCRGQLMAPCAHPPGHPRARSRRLASLPTAQAYRNAAGAGICSEGT